MKFPKIAVTVLVFFLWQSSIFANDFNNFRIYGQHWSKLDLSYKISEFGGRIWAEKAFVASREASQTIYRVIAQEDMLTLINASTQDIHTISVATKNISISKNYIFITPINLNGFYVLRLIDLYHFGFHSPIPLFFIPLDPKLGDIEDVVAEHNDNQQEQSLLLKLSWGIIKMEFEDITDIIKAQLISLATQNGILGNQAQELTELMDRTKKEIDSFYQDFYVDLNSVAGEDAARILPQELKEQSLEKISEDDLAKLLIKAGDSPELLGLKLKYIQRFMHIITQFYDDFSTISQKVEFSYSLPDTLADTSEPPSPSPSHPGRGNYWDDLDGDTHSALSWYAGITVGAVFLTFVLPKMLKKPFSQIGANYSCWHYNQTSWMGMIMNKLFPYVETSSTESRSVGSVLKKLIPEAQTSLSTLEATPQQFKRAFWQMAGDTATVIGTELLFRPHFRHMGEEGAESAILINEPFDENHSLWFQKNFLERVIGNQILGTINSTAQIHILEKEYDLLLQHFVFDSKIETTLAAQPRRRAQDVAFTQFNEEQRRQIAWMIHGDIKTIQEDVVSKVKALAQKSSVKPDLTTLTIEKTIVQLREKWLKGIQDTLQSMGQTASLGVQSRNEIEALLDTKIRTTYQIALEEHLNFTPQKAGILRKCLLAFKKATLFSLSKVFGEKLATQSFRIWSGMNEPYFWNALVMHHATRGSFNLTQFMYRRTTSLLFTTPFWLGTYQSLRNKGVINSLRREAMYGVAYGVVTNLTTHFIFVKVYEKYFLHSAYDIEFSLWELLGIKEKTKPKKEEKKH